MRPISASSRGVGLRREHLAQLCAAPARPGIDFLELAPENWMAIGGAGREQLQQIAARYPLVAHGLSLSLGDCQPLNMTLLGQIRTFLDEFGIDIYSEHLSFSRDARGYLYELLPVPRQWENLPIWRIGSGRYRMRWPARWCWRTSPTTTAMSTRWRRRRF